ncbi:PD40 domain-containing protein [candidate division KSB1 bacterium]|nr:PD40 domain-containing protein [candidate division KSB1 bacterium]
MWQVALDDEGKPDGQPVPLTTGLGIRSAVFSPDGKKLAYSKGRTVANLWRVPIPGPGAAPVTWADAQQMTFDQAYIENVDISADGMRIYFDSDRAGNHDLWTVPVAGGEPQQLTTNPAADFQPTLSLNGQELAFCSFRSGNRDVWVMPASGGAERQITKHKAIDFFPNWSPDGREIVLDSRRSGNADIWVIPEQGGEARPLTASPGLDYYPLWWPDGKSIIYVSLNDEIQNLFRVPSAGGRPEIVAQLTSPGDNANIRLRWSSDGRHIYFGKLINRIANIWSLSIEENTQRQLTDLSGRYGIMGTVALATDGEYLYFTWQEERGDIWVMDVEQEE